MLLLATLLLLSRAGFFLRDALRMIALSVKAETSAMLREMRYTTSQIPFATAVALTRTAVDVREAEYKEMRDVFDRPTPYTLNSLYIVPATKQRLSALVSMKTDAGKGTPATKYLAAEVLGGVRRLKRFELALRNAGVLPQGYFVAPGAAAKIDPYGNIDRSQIVSILSYFQAFPEAGYTANITARRKAKLAKTTLSHAGFSYFVGRPGGGKLPLGIWQRFSLQRQIRPIFIFLKSVLYTRRLDFDYVAKVTIDKQFLPELKRAIDETRASSGVISAAT
jgi:hypothetical protein